MSTQAPFPIPTPTVRAIVQNARPVGPPVHDPRDTGYWTVWCDPTVPAWLLMDPNGVVTIITAVPGSLGPPTTVTAAMSPYQVLASDTLILVDDTLGAVVLTLEAAPANGRVLKIKRIVNAGNNVTYARNLKLIEGAAADFVEAQANHSANEISYDTASGSWWFTNPGAQVQIL